MKKVLVVFISALTLMVLSGCGGDFEKGYDAYLAGDYANALTEFEKLAKQGHTEAQYYLGKMYQLGQGVTQYHVEAAKWFTLAAEQGNVSAQYDLGVMYYQGEGVTKDYTESFKWFVLAAQQGEPGAQFNLGMIYGIGDGNDGSQNKATALMWVIIASTNGLEKATEVRDALNKAFSHTDVAEAQRMAAECISSNYQNCNIGILPYMVEF